MELMLNKLGISGKAIASETKSFKTFWSAGSPVTAACINASSIVFVVSVGPFRGDGQQRHGWNRSQPHIPSCPSLSHWVRVCSSRSSL